MFKAKSHFLSESTHHSTTAAQPLIHWLVARSLNHRIDVGQFHHLTTADQRLAHWLVVASSLILHV